MKFLKKSIFTWFSKKKQMKFFLKSIFTCFWKKKQMKFFFKYFYLVLKNNQKIKLDVPSGLPYLSGLPYFARPRCTVNIGRVGEGRNKNMGGLKLGGKKKE